MNLLESIGDVLQEDEAENDVLVFGCVHRAAQSVGHAPQLSLISGRGALTGGGLAVAGFRLSWSSSCHMNSIILSTSLP